jgi:hypothetical protein
MALRFTPLHYGDPPPKVSQKLKQGKPVNPFERLLDFAFVAVIPTSLTRILPVNDLI